MHHRWAPAFTIVEILIIVTVIAIIASIAVVSYTGLTKLAISTAAQSDLKNVSTTMERALQKTGTFPETLPEEFTPSKNIAVTLVHSGAVPYYANLSTVQSGVLMAQICQELIDGGYGKGVSQGGQVRDYITGCGNWNHNSMQITGWDSKVWPTPVAKQPLIDYGANFTAAAWDIDQERVMEEFYRLLVERYEQQGGAFPVTSFWDYWATSNNGGVMQQPLDPNAPRKPYFCAEATPTNHPELVWHITEKGKIKLGGC